MTIDELAASLQVSFRAPIAEADEWRPLAQYIVQLLEAQKEACAKAIDAIQLPRRSWSDGEQAIGRHDGIEDAAEKVRATPLVTEEKP